MSRIQEILKKAEREGGVRRTRGLGGEAGVSAGAATMAAPMPLHSPSRETPVVRDDRDDAEAALPRRAAAGTLDARLVAALAPRSLAAEQYRSLRTRVRQAENGRALRSIIITSPGKGDGKSLTAANLALTMAQEFQPRVLLLDGDLRRPAVHTLFGMSETPGLSDVLMGGASLEDALVHLEEHHLSILPAGLPPTHPAELLGSAAMRRTIDTLRTRFDRIIIDMPPVEPLADVHILTPLADALLMIVRAGLTEKPAIDRALHGLDIGKVLGLVLNEADSGDADDSYNGYGYGYVAG
jgi:capsular exopolysaccharide synthesis family protein